MSEDTTGGVGSTGPTERGSVGGGFADATPNGVELDGITLNQVTLNGVTLNQITVDENAATAGASDEPGHADPSTGKAGAAGGGSADGVIDAAHGQGGDRERTPRGGRRRGRGAGAGAKGAAGAGSASGESDPADRAREIVLNQLTSRAKSRSELEKVLARKEIPGDVASAVLDRMTEVGLVDDTAFARSWVENRQQRNHLSRRALRHELSRKGVDSETLDEALDTVDVEDEYAAAKALAEKKFRSVRSLEPEVQRRRIAGALARKGFSYSITGAVLAEVLQGDQEVPESL